jgi:class 3 adenylate cyclase/tetratricopeptide (TPR) repeat protein
VHVCPSCGEENPERARFCLSCGAVLAEAAATGEERKVVSVLFVDLVGFTDRSDRADPEDVRATLRPYHERVKADIERFGGTVEKFIGDAVMAVFGAPLAHEDDAERALRAGLRILETIDELRTEGLDVAVRAAVTTGEVVVALGARPERGEGIVAGDVVNTAARLQAAAAVGTVIADETTMRSAEGAIAFEALEAVSAKGKSAPIPVWRVVQARSRVGEPETPTSTPFIGREHEHAVLFETFLRVERESAPQLVTVVGEAGVGKSRLVAELRSTLDDRPELVTWRHGRCLPYGEGITFWALGEVVKAEAGILESDDQDEAAGKLELCVSALVDDPSEREWFASRLAPLVGVAGEGGAVGRDESFTAWRRFLEAMAARRPLVVVVEDLHWADEALLDFLEHLLDWAAPVPLLVLSTARPELYDRRPGWSGGKRNATTVALSPLSAEETARLLQGLLERALLPADTQASIIERAGGNPLYTEQFARMLSERGDVGELPLPETVQALIAARLDTLSPELKGLLHDASVVGRTFWTGAVAALGDREHDEVLAGLRELVRREFIRPARVSSVRGDEEFSIWHALVRDVAYQQIPRTPRARKHVAAAAWIEESAQERIADHAEILVHHYEQALELSRAAGEDRPELRDALVRFLLVAGDRAMRLDIAAAEATYRRALELSTDGAGHATVLVKLAGALQEQGRLLDAEQAYEEALPALRAAGDERAAALAMVELARALWRHGQTARAGELTREAIPILERQPGPELLVAYERAAGDDAMGGRPGDGLGWAEKGIALADELGVENVVRHLQFRGMARLGLGDAGGRSDMRDALDLSLRLGLGIETATSYHNLGETVTAFEGVIAGLELVQASLDFARRCGLTHHEMWARATRLFFLYELGKWDELLREADEVVRWDRDERGGSQIEVWALIASAPVRVQRGSVDEARRDAATFLPRAREVANPQTLTPALTQAAFAFAAGGELDAAVTLAVEFEACGARAAGAFAYPLLPTMLRLCVAAGELPLAQRLVDGAADVADAPVSRHMTTAGRAILAEASGRTKEAAVLYAEAAVAWDEWGSVPERAYALLGLGRCGDEDAAREAAAIFERLGAVPFKALAA